jgi:ATP-dependent RNA helicase DeaD
MPCRYRKGIFLWKLEKKVMNSKFEELGLQPEFLEAVLKLGYVEPTSIQVETIPAILAGNDVIAQSQTGTGKTAAFMLPILQNLDRGSRVVQTLVLTPTRELAKQVAEAAEGFLLDSRSKILAVYGGQSYDRQIQGLNRGANVVVGTPGRLLDLIRRGKLDLSHVTSLVLDEADEMLEMGFIDDVELILEEMPKNRQVALFSATLPDQIRKLATKYLKNPVKVSISPNQLTVAETEQRYYRMNESSKIAALACLLETDDVTSALIFTRTKAKAQDLADELLRQGFSADSLHGDLNQARREMVLNRFRQGTVSLLVATDVAARGLDIQDVSHVFNFDMPADAEDYVHRIGRTGRAGKKGIAITLLTPKEKGRLNQFQNFTHQTIKEFSMPAASEVNEKRNEKLIARISENLLVGATAAELTLLTSMRNNGFNLDELVIGLIRMIRAGESKIAVQDFVEPYADKSVRNKSSKGSRENGNVGRGELPAKKWRDNPANDGTIRIEPGMVRLWMNLGNRNGLKPGDIVGAIAGETGIPGKAIGEINIHSNYSLVDVSENHVGNVLKAGQKSYRIKGKPVQVRLAD